MSYLLLALLLSATPLINNFEPSDLEDANKRPFFKSDRNRLKILPKNRISTINSLG